jgi:hypothetical protein
MSGPAFLRWFEPAAGVVLMLAALLDLFLTVLYARAGAGFISDRVARLIWVSFRSFSKTFGQRRVMVLSFSGSAIVVALVASWAMVLTLGCALIMHPYLGTSVRSSDKTTPTDFLTALYAGGSSMSLVGATDFSAKSTPFRIIYLFNSMVGMSVMSLALTYIMQVYNALQQRNTFGLSLDQMSRGTGDAAILIQGLGTNNEFSAGYSNLGEIADAISAVREAHDFYPVLFYFRFPEPCYSASRTTLIALDTVSLLRAAIPDGPNAWIKQAASTSQLWEAALSLLRTLECTFLPGAIPEGPHAVSGEDRALWTHRYQKAIRTMREAGIDTVAAEQEGVEAYIAMRAQWNIYISQLATYMAWRMEDIDPALAAPSGLI